MDKSGCILVVDDDNDILTASRLLLRRHFAQVVTCQDPQRIPELLKTHPVDAVLLDMNFGPGESTGEQGQNWLSEILTLDPKLSVVMITAHSNVDTAVEAMRRGATDFVAKPWQNEKVVATLSAAVKLHRSRMESETLRHANNVLRDATNPATPIVGDSPAINSLLSIVAKAAPTDANVLILGENGTGKELIARELHRLSARSQQVFLTVDMGSVSESLFESELFGHKKGAFTGATTDRSGRFQAANGGTLFLDEVGNLPLVLQAKLLSALEQRKVTPVGSDQSESVDVRIVAATNAPPEQLQDNNRFRQDLLFRLNTVEVTVPALRERQDDILPIARHYLALYAKRYNRQLSDFSAEAAQALQQDPWPGNVRALRHTIERAVILAPGNIVQEQDLAMPQSLLDKPRANTQLNLEAMEKDTIEKALKKHGFNISRAANELGLTRASLYRRMEKHDL